MSAAVVTIVAIAALGLTGSAAARATSVSQETGELANVFWTNEGSSGQLNVHTPSGGDTSVSGDLNGMLVTSDEVSWTVDRRSGTGTLTGTLLLWDGNDPTQFIGEVDVDLTWTAVGSPSRTTSTSQDAEGTEHSRRSVHRTDATVSGTIGSFALQDESQAWMGSYREMTRSRA